MGGDPGERWVDGDPGKRWVYGDLGKRWVGGDPGGQQLSCMGSRCGASGGHLFEEGPVARVNCIVRFLIEGRWATKWGNVHTMT